MTEMTGTKNRNEWYRLLPKMDDLLDREGITDWCGKETERMFYKEEQ